VRHHLARRVIAAVLVFLVDAGQLERRDLVGHVGRQLALDVGEFAFAGQFAIDLAHIHFQQAAARLRACAGASWASSGIAQIERTGVDTASTSPWRSVMRPRVAEMSITRSKRARPLSPRNSFLKPCR
jgi:hypothetical protein